MTPYPSQLSLFRPIGVHRRLDHAGDRLARIERVADDVRLGQLTTQAEDAAERARGGRWQDAPAPERGKVCFGEEVVWSERLS